MPKKQNAKSNQSIIFAKMPIAKIIGMNPKNVDILEKAGLHCLNCPWSALETLEQGAKTHQWGEKKLKNIIDQLNSKNFD